MSSEIEGVMQKIARMQNQQLDDFVYAELIKVADIGGASVFLTVGRRTRVVSGRVSSEVCLFTERDEAEEYNWDSITTYRFTRDQREEFIRRYEERR